MGPAKISAELPLTQRLVSSKRAVSKNLAGGGIQRQLSTKRPVYQHSDPFTPETLDRRAFPNTFVPESTNN